MSPLNSVFQNIIISINGTVTEALFIVLFALMYIVIAIGVIKKMYLFGNMQTLSVANKLITTAMISAIVVMIIIPIRDDIITRIDPSFIFSDGGSIKIEIDEIKGEIVTDDNGEIVIDDKGKPKFTIGDPDKPRFYAIDEASKKVRDVLGGIYGGILGMVSTLLAISIAISVLRIKFSMGNAEVITESRRMQKYAIFGFITILATHGIFLYFITLFNEIGLANPLLELAERENKLYSAEFLLEDKPIDGGELIDDGDRIDVPGLVSYTSEIDGSNERTWAKIGKTYTFGKPADATSEIINYYIGGFAIKQEHNKGHIAIYVNYGFQATIETNDGMIRVRVPRKEIPGSGLLKEVNGSFIPKVEGDVVLWNGDSETIPAPKENCILVSLATYPQIEELSEAFDSRFRFRSVGGLSEMDGDGVQRDYAVTIYYEEDNEQQKKLEYYPEEDEIKKDENLVNNKKEREYVLVDDLASKIIEANHKDEELDHYVTLDNVPDIVEEENIIKDKIKNGRLPIGVMVYADKNDLNGKHAFFGIGEYDVERGQWADWKEDIEVIEFFSIRGQEINFHCTKQGGSGPGGNKDEKKDFKGTNGDKIVLGKWSNKIIRFRIGVIK